MNATQRGANLPISNFKAHEQYFCLTEPSPVKDLQAYSINKMQAYGLAIQSTILQLYRLVSLEREKKWENRARFTYFSRTIALPDRTIMQNMSTIVIKDHM